MRIAAAVGWMLIASALVAGCNSNKIQLVSISGRVSYQGKDVPGGTVMLQPGSGRAIVAAINESGRYQASVPAGKYKVAVVSSAPIPDGVDPWKGKPKLPSPMVPDRFGRTETSNTSIAVTSATADKRTIDINLN